MRQPLYGGRMKSRALVFALICLAGCSSEQQPIAEGPIRLGGSVAVSLPAPLETPGLLHQLCLALPPGYEVDLSNRELISPAGERGLVSARLRAETGQWYEFVQVSLLSKGPERSLCLNSPGVNGHVSLRFVEAEINSSVTWSSPRGYWLSAEKL